MKIFELSMPDAQLDNRRLLEQAIKRKTLTESDTIAAADYIEAFINAYSTEINQLDLINGVKCLPLDLTYEINSKTVSILTVIDYVEYIKQEGSRLLFKYPQTNQIVSFPADGFTSNDEIRYIFRTAATLDRFKSHFLLKFQHTDWTISAYGYNLDGKYQPISI